MRTRAHAHTRTRTHAHTRTRTRPRARAHAHGPHTGRGVVLLDGGRVAGAGGAAVLARGLNVAVVQRRWGGHRAWDGALATAGVPPCVCERPRVPRDRYGDGPSADHRGHGARVLCTRQGAGPR